jgi:hypothetical protein
MHWRKEGTWRIWRYAKTEHGKLLPPLDGFRGIPCGFELFMNEFGGRVILLCERCAVKNGHLGASVAYLSESPSPARLSRRDHIAEMALNVRIVRCGLDDLYFVSWFLVAPQNQQLSRPIADGVGADLVGVLQRR